MKRCVSIAFIAAVAGCSATTATKPSAPTKGVTTLPQKSASAGQSCLQLSRIREARVVDDHTIDFYVSGREVLRNTLPNACPQLGFEKAFTYSTSLSQLCSVDIITVIIQGGGPRTGASCGLGAFVPYVPPAK